MVDRLVVDPDDLTLGEIEDIEKAAGQPFAKMMEGGFTASALVAVVYVVMRRDDPSFTIDDARRLKLGSLDLQAPDPTDAAS